MKTLFILVLLWSIPAAAADLSDADAGVYYFKSRDGTPANHFVVSKENDRWVLKDKDSGGPVAKVQCSSDCEYRATSEAENERLFPSAYRMGQSMVCVRNNVFAFCRTSTRPLPICGRDPVPTGGMCSFGPDKSGAKASYLMFPLFSSPKPSPISIWRADAP